MKKVILLVLISFLTLSSFNYPKNILGHWSIVKFESNGKVVNEKPFNWFTFEKDGIVNIGKDQLSKPGSWDYDENNKVIKIIFEGKTITDGTKEFKILKHTKKKLTLENISFTMYLEK